MTLEIDCNILIHEVQQRSPLYDTSKKQYHNRSFKKKLWDEVCQKVYSSSVWDSMSSRDKTKYGLEIQKRWSSLRHCFRRELLVQKKVSSGTEKKKRKYMYFDSLSFLLPFTEHVKKGSIDDDENELNNLENIRDEAESMVSKSRTELKNNSEAMVTSHIEGHQMYVCNSNTYDNGSDEDELFLRSLIPYMKEFLGDQKLLLRMEIIKSILNFKQSLNESSSEIKGF